VSVFLYDSLPLVVDGKIAVHKNCCCCDCVCSDCFNSQAPCCWKVVISDMADDSCSECESLNHTFYLPQAAPNSCVWECRFHLYCPYDCDSRLIRLTVYLDGSDYKIKVELANAVGDTVYHRWIKDYGESKPGCCDLEDEELTHNLSDGDCDSSSATCLITRQLDTFGCHCMECEPCVGEESAAEYLVEIEGIVPKDPEDCADCADLDTLLDAGVVAVPCTACEAGGSPNCGFRYDHESAICSIDRVRLCIWGDDPWGVRISWCIRRVC